MVAPIWQSGYPLAGSDSWGHLHRAAYMGRLIRDQGIIDGLVHSAWMPDWYMGDPTRVYYPPLLVWVLGPLAALFDSAFTAYRVLVTANLLLLALSVYLVGFRWGGDRWLAAMGAIMAVTSPFTLRTFFVEGNLSRGLALLTLPWIFWYTERILREKSAARPVGWLAVLWAVTITAHVMQAVMFAFALAIYIAYRAVDNVYVPLRRTLVAVMPVILGAGLAAAYILPAYSHAELTNVPYLPAIKVHIFSIPLDALKPDSGSIETVSVGIAAIVLAVLITIRTTTEHHKALILTGVASVVLAFGPSGGVFRLLPLHEQLLPERFLNISAVVFPLVIATTSRGVWRRRWIVLALALVLIIDARPALRMVRMYPAPPDEETIAGILAEQPLPGRVYTLSFPSPRASQIFLAGEVGQHANVEGWALENTPHHPAIRRLIAASLKAPRYLQRMLSLWNTDYVVARFQDPSLAPGVRAQLGFDEIATVDDSALWTREAPSSFAQTLPDNRMLIIGENPTSWLFAFPFASEGTEPDPAAYTPDYLAHYSVIGLTRLPEDVDLEAALGDWVRAGNTLIVDLSGLGRTFDQGFTLFGVHAISFALNGDYRITWPPALAGMPRTLPFTTPEGSWVGATYVDLEHITASLTHNGESYPLLGYQAVGQGRVWFVGFNLFYLLQETDQPAASDRIVDYLLSDTGVNRDLALPPLPITLVQRDSSRLVFEYTSNTATSAVLSMTYFPRWQARIDGRVVPLHDHEHLVLLDLPAGSHTVTLTYRPFGTSVSWLAWVVTGLFGVFTVLVMVQLKRHAPLATGDRVNAFDDRLPQVKPTVQTSYTSCPNCNFQLAVSGPPNERSYPFASLDCPVCGFSLGKAGFVVDATLSDAAKHTLVLDWMHRHHLDEQQLVERFGLTMDELFKPKVPDSDPSADVAESTLRQLSALAASEHPPAIEPDESDAAPAPAYSACPNCGFRLAHSNLLDQALYPLASPDCPICGFAPGKLGFVSRGTLSDTTKRLLAEAWVRRANLTESDLYMRFSLTLDELFEPEPADVPATQQSPPPARPRWDEDWLSPEPGADDNTPRSDSR